MTGAIDIQVERCRQIAVEGYTTAVDDARATHVLKIAASCYYRNAVEGGRKLPEKWPWDAAWWKPKSAREDLVRAGALYLAEKERVIRRYGVPHSALGGLQHDIETCAWVIDFFDKNGRLPTKEERQKRHIGAGRKAA